MAMDTRPPVVGIGASAGGIEALETFFSKVPVETEAAFVVITHLNPERPSLLPEIVQRFTRMPVTTAEDDQEVMAGNVYVMPENTTMTIRDGRLKLKLKLPKGPRYEVRPVDLFLSSLAIDQGEAAIGIILSGQSDVVFYSNRTGKYLEPAAGLPSRQLLNMTRKGIRLELRSAIRDAVSTKRRVERHNLSLEIDDGRLQFVAIMVEPLDLHTDEPLFIVVFTDIGPTIERDQAVIRVMGDQGKEVTALERELRDTRERLQSMAEEYETALEELKSSNEELVSVNEELQSTNEELEASKEELQSLNEELQTVNSELSHKIDELDQSNNDLRNLFDTSRIASVFVNMDLTIRSFTPLAGEIFNLLPGDRGRSLTIFSNKLVYPEFVSDLTKTIRTGEVVETRVGDENDAIEYLVRIQPYRDATDKNAGATVTFVDITRMTRS